MSAKDAVPLGMAARVGTLDETIARLESRAGRRRGTEAMSPYVQIDGTDVSPDVAFSDGSYTSSDASAEWTDEDEAAAMAAEPERDGLGEVEVAEADLAATQARRR